MSEVLTTLDYVRALDPVLIAHKRPDGTIEAIVEHEGNEHILFYEKDLNGSEVVQDLSFNESPVMFRYDKKLKTYFETKLAQKRDE